MSDVNEILTKIGLSENERKVYETIVAFGFRTAGQISSKTEIPYEKVFPVLEGLVEKNYLKQKEVKSKEGSIFFPLSPKIAISSDLSKNLSDRLTSLSTQISDIWKIAENTIDEDTTKLINRIKQLLDSYAEKIEELGATNQTSINNWATESKQSLSTISNEAITDFKAQVTNPLDKIASSLTELSQQLQTQSTTSMNEINSKTDEHQKSIGIAVDSIKSELGEFADEVGFILSGRISGLNQMIENISGTATDGADDIIERLKNDYTSFSNSEKEEYQSINNEFIKQSLAEYENHTSTLTEENTQYSENFGNLIDQSIMANEEIRNKTIESSKQLISDLDASQVETILNLQSQFASAVSTVQEDAVNQLGQLLNDTSEKLGKMNSDISSKLGNYQLDLGTNLSDLTNDVEQNLQERFGEIDRLLSEFVNNLKNSTHENVGDANKALTDLKDFLKSFLSEVQQTFEDQLQELTTSVNGSLESIVDTAKNNLDSSVGSSKEKLASINNDLEGELASFKGSINDFLKDSKSDLQNRLATAQSKFKEGVDQGVSSYQSESSKINELQTEQMNAIREEAEVLSSEAEKARNDALQVVNVKLNEIKNTSIEGLSERINSDVDKITRELQRYDERFERELQRFSEEFNDNTLKLREEIPQSIENMLLGQTNQLEGIRRQFDSNRRFISEFFETVETDLPPGEKNWKRKEFQTEFYERVQRIRGDFARFEAEFQRYFDFALEDTEDVKNEMLANFNRTIQDEVSNLDGLVTDQGKTSSKITKEFLGSMDTNKQQLSEDMTASVNDTIEELTSALRKNLLTKFEEPLESIISKSQAVATGTEGVDQENRIIKSQNLLIDKINEAVNNLVLSLQSAFDESLTDLDAKVEHSVQTSNQIVDELKSNITNAFETQNTTIESFTSSIKSELGNVQSQVNNQLQGTIDKTKSSVGDTFSEKGNEVDMTVSNKTDELNQATNTKLDEVDQSLNQFISSLGEIKEGTFGQIRNTINHSIATQKNALDTTIEDLAEATNQAREAINTTKSSLESNVGSTLAEINSQVSESVSNYKVSLDKTREELVARIAEYYSTEAKLQEITDLKGQLSAAMTSYLERVNQLQSSLREILETKIEQMASQHDSHLNTFTEHFSTKIKELGENNSDFILDLFDQVSTQMSSVQAEVLGSIENAKGNIENTVTNSVETVRTDILNPANEVVSAVSESTSQYASKLSELSSHFISLSSQEDSVIESARQQLNTKIQESIIQEQQNWKERGLELYGGQSSSLHDLAIQFETQVNSATQSGKEGVLAEINKIPEVIEDTLDVASKSMILLNEISKGAIELDPQTSDTSYVDVGVDAIKANLNGLLSRTKSSVTIVAPNIAWLDTDLIPGFTRASVRIIVDEDKLTFDDTAVLEKFKEHNVSVSLRRLDKVRYRDGVNMIMALRDKEEVMLSKLLTTEKPYAFVSQDDYFIEKFTELIQPFTTMKEF